MSGTVAERLAGELLAALEEATPHRHVLLWFDPESEFKRLVPATAEALAPQVRLMRHEPGDSQIALKLELLRRESSGASTVVYLPAQAPAALLPAGIRGGERPKLWALADYRFKGVIWSGGGEGEATVALRQWLEHRGVQPAFAGHENELVAGGADSHLARYAEMNVRTDPERWPRPLRPDDVRGRLAGDPTESALLLIASPRSAESEWGDRTTDVLRAISHEFGAAYVGEVAGQARSLVSVLALVDAWDAFGRRDDFPFVPALPSADRQRTRSLKLLRENVLRRQDVAPRYHDLLSGLSSKWAAIGPWAKDLPGQPLGMAHLARERVGHVAGTVDSSTSQSRAASLEKLRQAVSSWPMDRGGWIDEMGAVAAAVELLDRIRAASEEFRVLNNASALVDAYAAAGGWNQMDWSYLHLRHMMAAEPLLAQLRQLIDRDYVAWVAAANDRFSALVEAADEWPLPDTELTPLPDWTASPRNRRAVVVTDAMRLDVANAVAARLGDAELRVGLSTLPTTTPFGMAALLPHSGRLDARVDGTKLVLREGGSRHDLQSRQGRADWLTETLGQAGQSVQFVELAELVGGATLGSADLTVVFDYRLDDAGHGQGYVPDEVDGHVGRLARAVQRLHELGVGTVDVVTDHGFLHQPPELVEALGKPPVAPAQVHHRAARYAVIRPDAPVDSLVRLKSPLVPALQLGFARGIRTLEKPAEYLHGGISLQECVIGRIRSVRALTAAALGVAVSVPVTQLATGTVAVQIAPDTTGQMTLAAPPPRHLSVWIADRADQTLSDRLACEVRWDAPPQTVALYLREGHAIAAGSVLRLLVDDAETEERLHAEDLTLMIDWG